MAKDSGVIGTSKGEQQGRWVEDVTPDGRKRCLMVFTRDENNDANDQAYFGYYSDLSKADNGCNFALALNAESVAIQTVSTDKDAKFSIKEIPVSKFMDMLDALVG